MSKLSMLVAGGIGYVLGARAGRERYEQITGFAHRVGSDPRVQQKVGQAQEVVKQNAPVVKDKVVDAAASAAQAAKDAAMDKVGGSGNEAPTGSATNPAT